jgi:Rrf2 family iron-sulfur cluster assembly transcriptional regulator
MFSRSARIGIAAMSALAEASMTSAQIARRRRIAPAYLAKILTALARRGLIRGARGPGGGFVLARPPAQVSLLDIVSCFEPVARAPVCPLGRKAPCAGKQPCALHEPFAKLWEARAAFLAETTLAGFATGG